LSKCDKIMNKFEEPLNRLLEIFISIIVGTLGVIAFVKIMTPIESSVLYQLGDFLRFGLFTITLFLIMSFIAKPLFKMLKVES